MTYLLYPIALYLLLMGATYCLIFQRLLQMTFQYVRYESQPEAAVPDYLRDLFQLPLNELNALGFQQVGYLQVEPFIKLDGAASWEVLLYSKASKTYATVGIRRPIETVNPFSITFYTFFKDRTLLMTVNGLAHAIIGEFPNTVLHDPYAVQTEAHWQAHQNKLQELTGSKTICGLAPGAFIKALQFHYTLYVDGLVTGRKLVPMRGADHFHLHWQTALQMAIKLGRSNGKGTAIAKQRRQLAKTNPAIQVDIPIAVEVDGFQRQQQIEQGRIKRKWGIWVLLGSLLLSIASFTLRFDPRTLIILIGVLFLHELGHFLAMRLFRYRDTSMFFLPFFGAAVTGRKDDASLSEKFWVLLAGPLPGLLLGIGLLLATGNQDAPAWARSGLWMLIAINLFNLLPIYPLDGGKLVHLLWFSRYAYTDVLFKLFAVMVLALLGLGSPILLGLAAIVAITIPAGFRSAKLDAQLRRTFPKLSFDEGDRLLHAIFQTIKTAGYGKLPFVQRYNLAKDLVQRHRESHASWLSRIALSVLYCVSLLGGMVGTLQAVTPNWQQLASVAFTDPQTRLKRNIDAATQILAANPNDVKAYTRRGRMRLIAKDYQGAIADANQLIRLQPQDPDGYRIRSVAYRTTGDMKHAIADLKQANTLEQAHRLEQANQALRVNPHDAAAYLDRADVRHQQQDYKGAIADYSQSLRLHPSEPSAYLGRGLARKQLRDYKGAIADASQVIRLDPNNAEAYALRSEARRQLGDRKGAIIDQQKADALSPTEEKERL